MKNASPLFPPPLFRYFPFHFAPPGSSLPLWEAQSFIFVFLQLRPFSQIVYKLSPVGRPQRKHTKVCISQASFSSSYPVEMRFSPFNSSRTALGRFVKSSPPISLCAGWRRSVNFDVPKLDVHFWIHPHNFRTLLSAARLLEWNPHTTLKRNPRSGIHAHDALIPQQPYTFTSSRTQIKVLPFTRRKCSAIECWSMVNCAQQEWSFTCLNAY